MSDPWPESFLGAGSEVVALDADDGKRLGELRPLTGVRLNLVDEIVAVLVNQIFQRTRSDRRTVSARRRGLSQCDEQFNRLAPAPLDRLINEVAGVLDLLRDAQLKRLAFLPRAAR